MAKSVLLFLGVPLLAGESLQATVVAAAAAAVIPVAVVLSASFDGIEHVAICHR